MHKYGKSKKINLRRSNINIILILLLVVQILLPNAGYCSAVFADSGEIPVVIDKTVEGQPILKWTNQSAVLNSVGFDVYKVDYNFETGEMVSRELVSDVPVKLNTFGKIAFNVPEAGWYEIVENISGAAAMVFGEVDPLLIYVGPDGVMSSLNKRNADGTFKTQHTAGYAWGLKLIYENGYAVEGAKPDNSGQMFTTERFDVLLPDGTWTTSFCADLGAHNIYGGYIFDDTNHGFNDDQMFYIIAVFDYINEHYDLNTVLGKALAQITLWNLILEVDGNAGYAEDWWTYLHFDEPVKIVKIEGTSDWYEPYRDLIDDMVGNPSHYVDLYSAKLATEDLDDEYVTGVIFIKGNGVGYGAIDQQRQLLVLFGNSVEFDNMPYYDVALRKWVKSVTRDDGGGGTLSVYENSPNVPNTDIPDVRGGDKVTFTIETYNQTDNPTWITKLVDYIPGGYTFNEADNLVGGSPLWSFGSGSGGEDPSVLYYRGGPFLLADSSATKAVDIVLTVKPGVSESDDLRNAAEVLEIMNDNDGEPGKVVEDIDSTFSEEQRRNWDRNREKDNVIDENGKEGGDKDDYDFAEVRIERDVRDITVKKLWVDGINANNTRPASVAVQLYQDGVLFKTQTLIEDDNGEWGFTFYDLPRYKGASTIEHDYSIAEPDVPAWYDTSVSGFTITNTLKPITMSVAGTKIWADNGNIAGIRPMSITALLYQNGALYNGDDSPQTVGSPWTFEFTGLPVYDSSGEMYVYEVKDSVSGYICESAGYDIINKLDIDNQKIDIAGTKTWVDDDNSHFTRPDSVEIYLLRNGEIVESKTIVETNTVSDPWEYEFIDQPKYDEFMNEYVYEITEEHVPGYDAEYSEFGYDITNKLNVVSHVTNIVVKKEWVDGDDFNVLRPESVTVRLYQNGTPYNGDGSPKTILGSGGSGSAEFNNLPIFDEDTIPYVYSVREDSVLGYTTTFGEYEDITGDDMVETFEITITNKLAAGTANLSGTKLWIDDTNADNTRPANITLRLYQNSVEIASQTVTALTDWKWSFTNLPKYDEYFVPYEYSVTEDAVPGYSTDIEGLAITNTLLEGVTDVSGKKTWNTNVNSSAVPPEIPDDITVYLYQNGSLYGDGGVPQTVSGPGWEYDFSGLPKYDASGHKYVYEVREDPVPGFIPSYVGANIINTVDLSELSINVHGTKSWFDHNNGYLTRPASITVNLLRNGLVIRSTTASGPLWAYSFDNLPLYDNTFKLNTYAVDEVVPAGYNRTVSGSINEGFLITNTLAPGTTSVSGVKTWIDDGVSGRPEGVTISLLQDGVLINSKNLTSYGWSYSFDGLPVYSATDQHKYIYEIKEGATPGYVQNYTGFSVINTLTIDIEGRKTWDDSDNESRRPASITVNLLQNGVRIDTKSVTGPGWNWSFTNLPKYNGDIDHPYVYTITEGPVSGYSSTIHGYDITNTLGGGGSGGGGTPPPPPPPEPPEPPGPEPPGPEPPEPPTPEPPGEPEHTPGGTTTDIPPNPTKPGNSVVPGDEGMFIELDENGVPLGEWHWDEEENVWIFDEYPPLTDMTVPQTGADETPLYYFLFFGISLLGLYVGLRESRLVDHKYI